VYRESVEGGVFAVVVGAAADWREVGGIVRERC